ncbi:MAG TPA: hypothetical protein VLA85_09460 [Verrucomicrobiae bacterium]|nr:hypothetical protein [Verrucomicrobiae bacterium]
MDQPTGGNIALRQLGPLPDLDSVVFVRKQNRAFVTGQGPMATSASKGARRFLRAGTWLFLIAGVVILLVVGAMEYFERQQRAELEGSLRTVDAVVVGCDNTATSVPAFRYTAEGKTYEHYPPQTRADSCDKKPWQVIYVAGNPDLWAVAPDSPLPPFEDNIDAIWIVIGPCLFLLAAIYWLFTWFQERRAGKEARLAKEGGLLGAELVQAKYYAGDDGGSTIRLKYTMTPPKGQPVERKRSFSRYDLNHRALPPPGSKLLVLYVDETLHEVL